MILPKTRAFVNRINIILLFEYTNISKNLARCCFGENRFRQALTDTFLLAFLYFGGLCVF